MNANTQRVYNKIKEEVQNKLNQSKYISLDNLKDSIHKVISDTLEDRVKEFKVDPPMILWNSWSFKQKAIWFFMNRMGIGNSKKKDYYDSWNPETENYDLPKSFWIENKPKHVMITDIYFKSFSPAEYVILNLSKLNKG